jgi:hypothetical protein
MDPFTQILDKKGASAANISEINNEHDFNVQFKNK